MSASDLRKALESDDAFEAYGDKMFETVSEAISGMRADILALMDEERGMKSLSVMAIESLRYKERLDGYIQAALTGMLARGDESPELDGKQEIIAYAQSALTLARLRC